MLRRGFTLVELLVAIAIIGVLVALLLPALQAAREAARVSQCKGHLRQIGLAVSNHLGVQRHFPSGGWGYAWTGDPDRGFAKEQPGGWIYSILPYIEQTSLHNLGAGQTDAQKRVTAALRMETPLPLFNCPSRRPARQYPVTTFRYRGFMANAVDPRFVTRGDYAINVGSEGDNSIYGGGPPSLEEAITSYPWPSLQVFNGVSFLRSEVTAAHVSDGLSNTMLAGEKYLNADMYESGNDPSDGGHMYAGFAPDAYRLAGKTFAILPDKPGSSNDKVFGSPHLACHFVYCDGAVNALEFHVDRQVLEQLTTPPAKRSSQAPRKHISCSASSRRSRRAYFTFSNLVSCCQCGLRLPLGAGPGSFVSLSRPATAAGLDEPVGRRWSLHHRPRWAKL